MSYVNIEIKAKCLRHDMVEAFLLDQGGLFKGTDFQKDIYFNVASGRLKLRRGNIENYLIYYNREDQKGPKQSDFTLVPVTDSHRLEQLLAQALGIKVIVEKTRKIYFLDNVKIHLDDVPGLGTFVEIEAGNMQDTTIPVDVLREQCLRLIAALGIDERDLLENSYSDMLAAKK